MDLEHSEMPAPAPPSEPEDNKPSHCRRGNGYVARLPRNLLDQIGIMIHDGVAYGEILQRLGDPVKHITEKHISEWKTHTYQSWLADYKRSEALVTTWDSADRLLTHKAGVPVQDAGRTVAAAQLYEFLTKFNPHSFAAALEEKPELYLRIITTLARLSEGEASCAHHRALQSAIEAKLQSAAAPDQGQPRNLVSEERLTDIARQTKLL